MGDMALGYGSEFHLLRWLGRHRRLFTEKVCEAANRAAKRGWKHIDWLDFGFADGRLVPDSELCGSEFLTIGTDREKWPKEWEEDFKAMKAIGKDGLTDEHIGIIRGLLKEHPETKTWEKDLLHAPAWIRKVLATLKKSIDNEQMD